MERSNTLALRKRTAVRRLAGQGCSKAEIATRLMVSRPFIDKWLHAADGMTDRRG